MKENKTAILITGAIGGLGQALVIQLAKAKKDRFNDSHRLLYNHVASWLAEQISDLNAKTDGSDVIERLMDKNQDVYLRAQAEAMAYLSWLKQFARAYLNEQEG